MITQNYNPDVLNCLANLSSDEVFTPPAIANQMLDLLPKEFWSNPDTKFLDPACKSGVFLREIAKRLMRGLVEKIPDEKERRNHIFKEQIYGIAITELTSLLSRRSVYCSKKANSKYSVCESFDDEQGNIIYKRIQHTWVKGFCKYCGASQKEHDRDKQLETHAYQFIHINNENKFLKSMKFDVIISNPPYQLDTAGAGRQAKPIYPLFIEQAKKLNPRYLLMIVPSRWFSGGMGLDLFRKRMLHDKHFRKIVDFANAKDCFPDNSVSGGVNYFLWDRDNPGKCDFVNINNGNKKNLVRDLDEFPVLIRYNDAVSIIRKVVGRGEPCLSREVSSLTPFGLSTNYRGKEEPFKDSLTLYSSAGVSYISPNEVAKNNKLIGCYKIMISKTSAEHAGEPDKEGKFKFVTASLRILNPGEVCTHSYFVIGDYDNIDIAKNVYLYMKTKFVRFLLVQASSSINLSKSVFVFVPLQDFSESWTDEKLYKKYNLTKEEIQFIESMIRPMD